MNANQSATCGDLFLNSMTHAEGVNKLTYAPNGSVLYTTGAEGYMRVFDAKRDGDAALPDRLVEYHSDAITSVSATDDLICTSGEEGSVVLFNTTEGEKAGEKNEQHSLLFRADAGSLPRCVRFDPKGKRVAIVQDKLEAVIIDAQDNTNLVKLQHDSDHGEPREISWSPDGNYVTTSTTKGFIKMWSLPGGNSGTCVRSLDGIIPLSTVESPFSVEAIWHPSSKYFAVVNRSNEIVKISRDNWSKIGTFTDNSASGHSSQITNLAWSPNGNYLASSSDDGKVLVWNTSTQHVVSRLVSDRGTVTSLQFHPKKNEVGFLNFQGDMLRWKGCVPADMTGPHVLPQQAVRSRSDSVSHSKPPAATTTTATASKKTIGEELDEEMAGLLDQDALVDGWMDDSDVEGHGGGNGGNNLDDDGEDLKDMIDDDDLDLDDDVVAKSRGGARDWMDSVINRAKRGARASTGGAGYGERTTTVRGQAPFQPGSTPMRERRRYLAFNMLGLIHIVERGDQDDPQNLVSIEFHDRSTHVGMHFTDTHGFTNGALGELGAVFSVKAKGESPSLIFYKPYESWTPVFEWLYELPPAENATILAIGGIAEPLDEEDIGIAGTGTILVATDKGYIRSFSGSGLQKYVWNFGKEVVAMSAGKDWAIIVYRGTGGPVDGEQNLEFALVDLDTFEAVQERKVLPLSKGTTLKWIGFSDENIPVMYDSRGVLSILDAARRPGKGRWVPLLDMHALERRKGKQESYWPIGVTEKNVNAIILKGEEQYPHFPTPVFQEIELQMPLLRLDVQQGILEEQFLRGSILISQRRDGAAPDDYALKGSLARQEVVTDKNLLIIIQTSCKAENLQAALDAVLLLSQPASLDAAKKIAAFFQLPALADRIDLVKEAKTGLRRAEEENKRGGKWSHLVDDRTIANSAPRHAYASSSTPGFNDYSYSRPSSVAITSSFNHFARPDSVVPAARPKTTAPARLDSGFGGSDEIAAEDHPLVDGEGQDEESEVEEEEPSPKRMRSVSEEETRAEVPLKTGKALNPFAKKENKSVKPTTGPPQSAFGKKSKQPATDLHRTGSFFDRAGGDAPPKGKAKAKDASSKPATAKTSTTGSKQTTLFGLPPPAPKPIEKKGGKKRKSSGEPIEEGDDALVKTPSLGKTAFLSSSGMAPASKELPREGDEFEESQMADETQESQASRTRALETHAEDPTAEDAEMAETQVEQSQVVQVEKENTPVAAPQNGISKLAQFRMATASAAE